MNCHHCNTPDDLRPYGPNYAMVCFACAMSTSERKAETDKNFEEQINGCGENTIIIGEETGPRPINGGKQ